MDADVLPGVSSISFFDDTQKVAIGRKASFASGRLKSEIRKGTRRFWALFQQRCRLKFKSRRQELSLMATNPNHPPSISGVCQGPAEIASAFASENHYRAIGRLAGER